MKKIIIAALLLGGLALASCCDKKTAEEGEQLKGYTDREAIDVILSRKSVREYVADKPVEQEKIDLMVRAGMAAPSGRDLRPWEIVVIDDKAAMAKLAEDLPYAKMLAEAPLAFIVCGSPERSSYWYVDCSAVTQNILLAAEALGIGAVWTGAYPYEERMEAVKVAIGLPDGILPLCVIPMGYPKGDDQPKDKYDAAKLHRNKW